MMIGRAERISSRALRPKPAAAPYLALRGFSSAWGIARSISRSAQARSSGSTASSGPVAANWRSPSLASTARPVVRSVLAEHPLEITSVADALHHHGIGYVSEDRKGEGLILMHSVLDNAGITVWRRLAGRLGFLRGRTVARPSGR